MQENYPVLISCKSLKSEHDHLQKIPITSEEFSIGRGLKNSVVIPFLSISRNHCLFKKLKSDEWTIEDYSSFGIEINRNRLGKGAKRKLCHEDIIVLEPSQEFVYKFIDPMSDTFEIPKKRIKLENNSHNFDIINNVKMKFEESQSHEIKHIEQKILSAQHMQTTSKMLKEKLQLDMSRKIQQLETDFALQIENLKGEKNEVEQQKAFLIEERDAQLATIKKEMEGKIAELMEQIQKLNETESELLQENNSLKEKLLKEREEFLLELSRESSSKKEMLEKLEAKVREQEEIRIKEKQELEDMLRRETEQLKLAKEKELQELEAQKQQRELELVEQLNSIKKNLQDQVAQTEQQRLKAEQVLNEQVEQMKKLSDEEKVKMQQLVKEREEIQNKLTEERTNKEKSLEVLRAQIQEREIELSALAAERIQQQADQSGEVISCLQQQLEKVRSQLQLVESEKNNLLEGRQLPPPTGEGSSKQATLEEVGEVMESELQCSICGELFVSATTLNCSHTFCKYCITMWKKKKKDCPICRTSITSECRSLVLDSFIERMQTKMSEDTKIKRQELLASREELESELARQVSAGPIGRVRSYDESASGDENSEGEEIYDSEDFLQDELSDYSDDEHWPSDSDSGSDGDTDTADPPASSAGASTGYAGGEESAADSAPGERSGAGALAPRLPNNATGQLRRVEPSGVAGWRGGGGAARFPDGAPRLALPPIRFLQSGQSVMVMSLGDSGAVASPASRAPTTAATADASTVAPADTGRPAAPSDNTINLL